MQELAQVDRHQAEHAAQDEGHAPGPVVDLFGAVGAVEPDADDGAQENAARDARSQRADGKAIVARRRMLGHKDPGARHLATNGRALQHAHGQQQNRRGDADGGVGGQQADHQRGHGHQEDGQREHLLAAQDVAKVRNQNAADGPGQIARRKNAQRLQLAQPVRHLGREEQLADDIGEENENDEVVELQGAAQGRQAQGLVVLSVERTCGRNSRGHARLRLVKRSHGFFPGVEQQDGAVDATATDERAAADRSARLRDRRTWLSLGAGLWAGATANAAWRSRRGILGFVL